MKTIIAGGRDLKDQASVDKAMQECGWLPTLVISGGATGADHLGELWAHARRIPVVRYPADWKAYGKAAGPIRNREMAEKAETLVAIWDGKSPGTRNMIRTAQELGLKVHVELV